MQKIALTRLGEVLLVDHMVPLGMTINGLAEHLGIPALQVKGVISGRFSVDRELATTFAEMFRTTPEFWLNLQAEHGSEEEREPSLILGDEYSNSMPSPPEDRNNWMLH